MTKLPTIDVALKEVRRVLEEESKEHIYDEALAQLNRVMAAERADERKLVDAELNRKKAYQVENWPAHHLAITRQNQERIAELEKISRGKG